MVILMRVLACGYIILVTVASLIVFRNVGSIGVRIFMSLFFFTIVSSAYLSVALRITLCGEDVIFDTVSCRKIVVKNSDIISVRKTYLFDRKVASFTFHVKGVGDVGAGIFHIKPVVKSLSGKYAEIRQEDFPYADFIDFDE